MGVRIRRTEYVRFKIISLKIFDFLTYESRRLASGNARPVHHHDNKQPECAPWTATSRAPCWAPTRPAASHPRSGRPVGTTWAPAGGRRARGGRLHALGQRQTTANGRGGRAGLPAPSFVAQDEQTELIAPSVLTVFVKRRWRVLLHF